MFASLRSTRPAGSRPRRRLLVALLAALTVAAPAGAMTLEYLFTARVPAGGRNVHVVPATSGVIVDGDGDTDLDCFLYRDGQLVDSDTDATDVCVLSTNGRRGWFTLVVRNFGTVYNQYDVDAE